MSDIGLAFSVPFKDPAWGKKFFIGALIVLLCVTGLGLFVLAGYCVELTQRVMRREQLPLPEWSDLGVKLILGAKYAAVQILYVLPLVILAVPMGALMTLATVSDQSGSLAVITSIYGFGFALFAVPYGVLLSLFMPIIAFRFAARERIGDALQIGAIVRTFKRNWEGTLVVAVLTIGVQTLAMIGVFALVVGVLVTLFYVYVVSSFLYGLLYVDCLKKGGERLV
jgi:hypothetical protein